MYLTAILRDIYKVVLRTMYVQLVLFSVNEVASLQRFHNSSQSLLYLAFTKDLTDFYSSPNVWTKLEQLIFGKICTPPCRTLSSLAGIGC